MLRSGGTEGRKEDRGSILKETTKEREKGSPNLNLKTVSKEEASFSPWMETDWLVTRSSTPLIRYGFLLSAPICFVIVIAFQLLYFVLLHFCNSWFKWGKGNWHLIQIILYHKLSLNKTFIKPFISFNLR